MNWGKIDAGSLEKLMLVCQVLVLHDEKVETGKGNVNSGS